MTYEPNPVNLDDIELPSDLLSLKELIAEHVHDVWSQERIENGWTYGEKRNDDAKTNPCLVPYDQLKDSEKEYDRITAINTLKLIMHLGYDIVKK